MHISLPPDVKLTLKEFAEARGESMSAVIKYALIELFRQEALDPKRNAALKAVLSTKFEIPAGYSPRTFYVSLWMLAQHYSEWSSRDFWGPAVYLSSIDKTHGQVIIEIAEEVARAEKIK